MNVSTHFLGDHLAIATSCFRGGAGSLVISNVGTSAMMNGDFSPIGTNGVAGGKFRLRLK